MCDCVIPICLYLSWRWLVQCKVWQPFECKERVVVGLDLALQPIPLKNKNKEKHARKTTSSVSPFLEFTSRKLKITGGTCYPTIVWENKGPKFPNLVHHSGGAPSCLSAAFRPFELARLLFWRALGTFPPGSLFSRCQCRKPAKHCFFLLLGQ